MTATVVTPRPADPAISLPFRLLARNLLPDSIVRFGIRRLLTERLREEKRTSEEAQQRHLMRFIAQLKASPIAINTREANEQHYELPCEFFELVLGKHLKYSSCYFNEGVQALEQAYVQLAELPRRFEAFHQSYDVILSPVLRAPPKCYLFDCIRARPREISPLSMRRLNPQSGLLHTHAL